MEDIVARPSPSGFVKVFSVVFFIYAMAPLLLRREHVRIWPLLVIATLWLLFFVRRTWIQFLADQWQRFGLVIHRITQPVILGLAFFLVITPMALLLRLRGKHLLATKWQKEKATYWIERAPAGPAPESLRQQF
jgi:hypothetical protein